MNAEPVEEPYRRRVSNNERIYIGVERVNPAFCVELVVEGDGELSASRLEGALEKVARVNPGSRLLLKGHWLGARWVATGPVPPVREIPSSAPTTWRSESALPASLQRPLPPREGPTCEVVLCQGAPFRVVFRAFHGVMDAGGLVHWVNEIFRSLRGEPLRSATSTLLDRDIVRELGGKRSRPSLPLAYPSATGKSPSIEPGVVWRRETIRGPLPGLVAKAAVGVARHAKERGVPRIRTMVPVDLRNYRPDLAITANASYPIFVDVGADHDWQSVYKTILKKLSKREALALGWDEALVGATPLPLLPLTVRALMDLQWRKNRFQFTASIAHLPKLDLARLSADGFSCRTAYFLPAASRALPLAVAAVSHSNGTEVTVTAPRALAGEAELEAVSQAIFTSLRAKPPSAPEKRP